MWCNYCVTIVVNQWSNCLACSETPAYIIVEGLPVAINIQCQLAILISFGSTDFVVAALAAFI